MVEVQGHGFSFEKWMRDTLFESYEGNYMQKWDVPPEHNKHQAIPDAMRSLPVSIKTAKHGSPIGLGDVLRQRSIADPFLMIAGFWKQRSPAEKWFEDIGCARFSKEIWNSLWGTVSLSQLSKLDALVKDTTIHYREVRVRAQDLKAEITSGAGCVIVINPKIDSKKQRRVQCSLPFDVFWQHAGRQPVSVNCPKLFGFAFDDNPVISTSRKFNRGQAPDGPR